MAYLDEKTLTCPTCGLKGTINIVVGVGPHSNAGDTPYRRARQSGPFTKGDDGALLCPDDGSEVWRNTPGQKAETAQ